MKDWREELLYTMDDTKGCSFQRVEYHSSVQSDHEHCSICFAKISDSVHCQGEKHGFYCKETGDWLCDVCFNDFKKRFNWNDEES